MFSQPRRIFALGAAGEKPRCAGKIRGVRVIGLMSGTSADGLDAALVEWPDDGAVRPFRLLGFVEQSFPPELQDRIHRLAAGRVPSSEVLRELALLDVLPSAAPERFR